MSEMSEASSSATANGGPVAGANTSAEARGRSGDIVRVTLRMSAKGVVEAMGYESEGWEQFPAVLDEIALQATDKGGLKVCELTWVDIETELGHRGTKIDEEDYRRVSLALAPVRWAIRDFFTGAGLAFTEDDLMLCKCMAVPEDTVRAAIADNGFDDHEAVGDECDAGLGCSTCHADIKAMMDVYWTAKNG